MNEPRYYMGLDLGRQGEDSCALVTVRDGKVFSVNPLRPDATPEERARLMGDLTARFAPMRYPTEAAIVAEADALDKITVFLDQPDNRRGRTIPEISAGTQLAIGRVQEICRKSEIILKPRPRNPRLWFNDWDECEPAWRPKRKAGRPAKPKTA